MPAEEDLFKDAMTVGKLREILEKFDDEDIVVMSSDSEGNSYGPMSGFSDMIYIPKTTWYGDILYAKLTKRLKSWGYTKEDVYNKKKNGEGKRAIVLWPTN